MQNCRPDGDALQKTMPTLYKKRTVKGNRHGFGCLDFENSEGSENPEKNHTDTEGVLNSREEYVNTGNNSPVIDNQLRNYIRNIAADVHFIKTVVLVYVILSIAAAVYLIAAL